MNSFCWLVVTMMMDESMDGWINGTIIFFYVWVYLGNVTLLSIGITTTNTCTRRVCYWNKARTNNNNNKQLLTINHRTCRWNLWSFISFNYSGHFSIIFSSSSLRYELILLHHQQHYHHRLSTNLFFSFLLSTVQVVLLCTWYYHSSIEFKYHCAVEPAI